MKLLVCAGGNVVHKQALLHNFFFFPQVNYTKMLLYSPLFFLRKAACEDKNFATRRQLSVSEDMQRHIAKKLSQYLDRYAL